MIVEIECPDCEGFGGRRLTSGHKLECKECNGTGKREPKVGEQMLLFDLDQET